MKIGSSLATLFIALVSFGHLLRVVFHLEFKIANFLVPQWMSVIAFLVCGLIAFLLYKECKTK
jgi:hypothetical protein